MFCLVTSNLGKLLAPSKSLGFFKSRGETSNCESEHPGSWLSLVNTATKRPLIKKRFFKEGGIDLALGKVFMIRGIGMGKVCYEV